MGVSLSALDAEVRAARSDRASGAIQFDEVEPWPDPVRGDELLDDIAARILNYLVIPDACRYAVSMWIVFTWAIDLVDIAPILAIKSPEKRFGKSTLLDLLQLLVYKHLTASNISSAALFRTIEKYCPTLLIDEGDSFMGGNEELRGILNSGHTRSSAYVIRTVTDDYEPAQFRTWGAKAIALIGRLPETLADRSISIELRRKLPSEKREKLRHAEKTQFITLRRKLNRLVLDKAHDIKIARPEIPEWLHDRAADNWEPLFAIADIAGGEWPRRAQDAAKSLAGESAQENETDSLRIQLLSDIRDVFAEVRVDRISWKAPTP